VVGFYVIIKNIGFHKIQDYFYKCETFLAQEVLRSMLLAQYFRTKQTDLPAAVYCKHKTVSCSQMTTISFSQQFHTF